MKILKAHKCNYRIVFTDVEDYIRYDPDNWGVFPKESLDMNYMERIYDKKEIAELENKYQIYKRVENRK